MTDSSTYIRLLRETPITALSVGRSSFRRTLASKGYSNLLDVLELSDAEIDREFNLDTVCTIESLQHAYKNDPEAFAKKALERAPRTHSAPATQAESKPKTTRKATQRRITPSSYLATNTIGSDLSSYLCLSFISKLLEYDKRARDAFDELNDRQDNVIVYQAFDAFATEFDDINENFQHFFDYFEHRSRDALAFIDKYLRNIFLIYVADRARTFHEHQGFWAHYFPTIHISSSSSNTQTEFKRVFYTCLQRKNMPVYQNDESARHFYLTALLHGGLSRSSWAALWETAILPLANASRLFGSGPRADVDGRTILKTILDDTNAYTPPRTELELLRKAPVALVTPLLESALQVGLQVESGSAIGSGPTMLTSYGLPDVAIEALIDLKSRDAAGRNNPAQPENRREFLALPKAELQLDLSRGRVVLCWNKQLFPLSRNRRRIDYYVDDEKMGEQPLHYGVNKCTLDSMRIDVDPRPQYEVSLKLMEFSDRSDSWKEIASLDQYFERLNPGCFEFIQNTQGIFSLRRPSDRITRTRTVAYILEDGLSINPGMGMELVEKYEPQGTWNALTIHVYKVTPGSNGSILAECEDGSQEEIAVWQENYRSHIDKTGVLGATIGGIDLYGFIPDENGNNIGLPCFYIEAFNGRAALDDLEIICKCDDESTSIKREVLWEDVEDGDSQAARIKLSPTESSHFFFNKHINLCTIEARQRSAGNRPIFKYKFCVTPIQDFHLESVALNGYDLDAVYSFESSEEMYVIDQLHAIQNKDEHGRFTFTMPLSSSVLPIRIVSSLTAKTTDALIDLAALDISIPHHLVDRAKSRPLCLPDAQAGYIDGQCNIKTSNWSQSRAVLVQLGGIPLYYKELSRPNSSSFSIFSDISNFLQTGAEGARYLPLTLCVYYGYKRTDTGLAHTYAVTTLLDCKEGFGFTTWDLRFDSRGDAFVKFDAPLLCDVQATLQQTNAHNSRRQAEPFVLTLHEGDDRIPLPRGITTALLRHRTFEMSLTLLDDFAGFASFFFDDEEDGETMPQNGPTSTFILKGPDHRDK